MIAPKFTHPLVTKLHENLIGRDFVVMDIHGTVGLLEDAMDAVNFDCTRDRLFLGGDLIDRGSESHLCAEILKQPYVYAVRGNHEDMLIELYENMVPDEELIAFLGRHNGFKWWSTTSESLRAEILNEIRKLPLAIEISTGRGLVGIIHAEVPRGMHWNTFIQHLERQDQQTIKSCLWGRDRFTDKHVTEHQQNNSHGVPGIGRLFVGHNMHFDGLKQFGNVYALDTAAVHGESKSAPGARLTMVNALMCTTLLLQPKRTGLIDVRDDLNKPSRKFS